MSYDSTYTSPSIAHVCSDRPADSTRIVSYIRRQYARTVPNVVIVGSTPRFNYVLATNSNPVTTCALDGRVNPYPNTCTTSTRTRRALVVPGTVGGHLYFELAWCEVFISIRRRDSWWSLFVAIESRMVQYREYTPRTSNDTYLYYSEYCTRYLYCLHSTPVHSKSTRNGTSSFQRFLYYSTGDMRKFFSRRK
jgi:hypothetical protein